MLKNQVPDCPGECPIEDIDFDDLASDIQEMHKRDCDECWWHTQEAHDLMAHSELFSFCSEWLALREIGLETDRELLTYKDEQAIAFVHREQAHARSRLTNTSSRGED